ncbi:hypothetical protein FACS189499_05220 [Clostridia bacterium]|nr:hypothetical protein FACS189499_05220 [Clostridia bacterium]
MINVLVADVTPLLGIELFNEKLQKLSPRRQERAARYRFQKDRALSLGVGLLCDKYLSGIGFGECDSGFAYDSNGAPYFTELPSLRVSLSHSGVIAAAAFCQNGNVGIDVETVKEFTETELEIAKRCFSQNEINALSLCERSGKARLFSRFWTERESLFKYNSQNISQNATQFFGFHGLTDGYAMTVCAGCEEELTIEMVCF